MLVTGLDVDRVQRSMMEVYSVLLPLGDPGVHLGVVIC